MQIRRENIVAIAIPTAVAIIFWLLPYEVITMPMWVVHVAEAICGITIIVSILALTPIWDKLFKKKPIGMLPPIAYDGDYDNVYKIIQLEPSKKPPLFIDVLLTICGVIILAYGIWIMYVWGMGRMLSQFGLTNLLLFYLLFIAFPLWFLADTLIIQRKQYKLGRSIVATKPKSITIRGGIDDIFNRALQAINAMQGSIIIMDRRKLVKAQLKGSMMTVTTTNIGHGYARVNFVCDSQWITTKIDFGKTKRYANSFEQLLLQKQKK